MKIILGILIAVGVALVGFAGGFLYAPTMGWIRAVPLPQPNDAVAIANTYIVFTTFLFVGFTVVLAALGIVFSHHFSISKESQVHDLSEELKRQLQQDDHTATDIIKIILEDPRVIDRVDNLLSQKVALIISERFEGSGDKNVDDLSQKIAVAREDNKMEEQNPPPKNTKKGGRR